MTDLELTRLCAEAMGYVWDEVHHAAKGPREEPHWRGGARKPYVRYHPLHDDAQAMALVKKFGLCIDLAEPAGWHVTKLQSKFFAATHSHGTDLNRCICECVAKTQAAKFA